MRFIRKIWHLFTRAPVLLDHRGLRWLLGGRVVPVGPIVFLRYRGRRTSKLYTTPVEAIAEDKDRGEVMVSPARGSRTDWYRNIRAGGLIELRLRGRRTPADWRELSYAENRAALEEYKRHHKIWGRVIIWMLARQHRLKGDSLDSVARALPMLALRARLTADGTPASEQANGRSVEATAAVGGPA